MKIVFATHNQGKLAEMKRLLSGLDIELLGAEEAGVMEDVVEDGKTFKENVLKKAMFVAKRTGEWTIADDSGLCIDAFDGQPGVHTARWAGEKVSKEKLADYTIEKMKDIPASNRMAFWKCVIVLIGPDGRNWMFDGRVDGIIALQKKGLPKPALPYDPIFIPNGEARTFSEMSDEEKNSMSHRGRAVAKLKVFLNNNKRIMSIKNGVYKHFKGGRYRVLGVAKHSETLKDLVIYQKIDDKKDLWARPLEMFLGEVEVDGNKTSRFKYIGG